MTALISKNVSPHREPAFTPRAVLAKALVLTRLGQWLFRYRSVTPLPVIAALTWVLWTQRGADGPGGSTVDTALDFLGVLLALGGEALRFRVVGLVPEGTSGQNNRLEATVLNTRGAYAHVRNPLYVGNLGICLGLFLIAHRPEIYVFGLLFFFGEYFFIIRAEEAFLRSKFGAGFDDYMKQVPRWIPRFTAANDGVLREGGFDWRRALKKEHNPMAAWMTGVLALLGWEAWFRSSSGLTPERLAVLVSIQAMVLVGFVAVKGWKHGWLTGQRA